jgi:hypothetical protein
MTLPATCHSQPWALIRRNGDTPGKRLSTRMAYLIGTIAPNGIAVALTGYIMRNDMTGWTKHPRWIEWSDIIRQWTQQPTVAEVRKLKARLPVAPL